MYNSNLFLEQLLNEVKGYQAIFVYISLSDEVNTIPFIKELFRLNKTVIVPKSDVDNLNIIPSKLNSFDDLVKGSYGILEPVNINFFPKEKIDIFFIPGTKFDSFGNRKGRGKGYFDRFLEDIKNQKYLVGLCYEDQVIDNLEINSWDIPMDKILTKKRIINRNKFK